MPVLVDIFWKAFVWVTAFRSHSLKTVCTVGQALSRVRVNSVVSQIMMHSNVINVDITVSRCLFVFSQSRVKVSASLVFFLLRKKLIPPRWIPLILKFAYSITSIFRSFVEIEVFQLVSYLEAAILLISVSISSTVTNLRDGFKLRAQRSEFTDDKLNLIMTLRAQCAN